MRALFETLAGIYQLARLALLTGFNLKNEYWRWRHHTAFGRGTPPRREMLRAVLDYGRWVHRTRRMM